MITKGEFPLESWKGARFPPLIEAYFELSQLKRLYRQGWLKRGVPAELCESVAEHVLGMAMLAWWLADQHYPELDRERVLRMALAHELGEVYTGDLTPADGVSGAEKHRRERESLEKVTGKLSCAAEMLELWEEYEAGRTGEALFVRQVDRLEMAFQAAAYKAQGFDQMDEFFRSAEQALTDPVLQDLLAAVRR